MSDKYQEVHRRFTTIENPLKMLQFAGETGRLFLHISQKLTITLELKGRGKSFGFNQSAVLVPFRFEFRSNNVR